jgi:LmbE family N-acetylglucosaminyl deacetylase
MFERFRAVLEEQGADVSEFPQPDPEQLRVFDAVEARITTAVDVGPYVERKRTALATHASQIEESLWAHLPTEAFGPIFGEESFIRAHDTTGAPLPEADLFAGLR